MRKQYVKPEADIEEIQMNQAIAACSGGSQGYTATYMGWVSIWGGGANGTKYDSFNAAKDATSAPDYIIVQAWEVSGPRQDGSTGHVAYYEDTNHNGELDGARQDVYNFTADTTTDHWQSVWSPGTDLSTVFVS